MSSLMPPKNELIETTASRARALQRGDQRPRRPNAIGHVNELIRNNRFVPNLNQRLVQG